MIDELSFPRHFGEYVLVAQLGEDGLGTVYRALAPSDERRFMRLRILQSAELSPEAVAAAVRKNATRATSLLHKTIVLRTEMGVLEGVPFVAWHEAAGWTLDVVLARLRATSTLIPPEYALLIADRIAEALSHAWFSVEEGEPFHHGLLWPGFVSISNEAEVRVGGFGVAQGILSALAKPRLLRDVAPYLAPEVREKRHLAVNSDVYSLGVLLLELLTGRRPTVKPLLPELRAEDPFAAQMGTFLGCCFADSPERFSSVVQMHRVLQELLAASPYALSTASLAVFLYKLLNPESRALPATDAESTNPVPVEAPPSRLADPAAFLPEETAPGERRRRAMTPLLLSTTHEEASLPQVPTPAPSLETASAPPAGESAPPIRTEIRPELIAGEDVAARSAKQHVPMAAIALAASLVLIVVAAVFLRASSRSSAPLPATYRAPAPIAANSLARADSSTPRSANVPVLPRRPRSQRAAARRALPKTDLAVPAAADAQSARKPAEDLRLAAALARIEAERLDAAQWASELLLNGRSREQEGEHLLAERDWGGAQASFRRATALFRAAESAAREERVRHVQLLPPD